MGTRLDTRIVPKTAAYTIRIPFDSSGTVFTNRGASGSVTFTLPTPNKAGMGHYFDFRVYADQSLIVAAPSANTLVTLGDIAADNVGFQVATKKVGRGLRAFCDGTSWFAFPLGAFDGFCIDGAEFAPSFASGAVVPSATLVTPTITTPTSTIYAEVLAALGNSQGTAAPVVNPAPCMVHVTGADGTKGISLPAAAAGKVVWVKNSDAANAILPVYPAAGDAINAIAANSPLSMAAKTAAVFVAIDATTWFSFSLLPS